MGTDNAENRGFRDAEVPLGICSLAGLSLGAGPALVRHLQLLGLPMLCRLNAAWVGYLWHAGAWSVWDAERPIGSLVLVQPSSNSRLHILAKDLTFAAAVDELNNLRRELGNRVGTERINFVQHGDFPPNSLVALGLVWEV